MVVESIARNLAALRKAESETAATYLGRLAAESRRRLRQLGLLLNPLSWQQYRREKLVGPIGIWDALQQYQMEILQSFGLEPHHSVLDIGCGPLTVGTRLIARLDRGRYVGLDLCRAPLLEAYRVIAENELADKNPVLISSSSFGEHELGDRRFDFIWVSQLSYHLDDAQVLALFRQIRARMTDTSVALIDVIDPATALPETARWSIFPYYVRPYGFFEEAAREAGLEPTRHDTIAAYGYPTHINLSGNRLYELRQL